MHQLLDEDHFNIQLVEEIRDNLLIQRDIAQKKLNALWALLVGIQQLRNETNEISEDTAILTAINTQLEIVHISNIYLNNIYRSLPFLRRNWYKAMQEELKKPPIKPEIPDTRHDPYEIIDI